MGVPHGERARQAEPRDRLERHGETLPDFDLDGGLLRCRRSSAH